MGYTAWWEKRDGELFFVEAVSTRAGWVFSERSTYEDRWFAVPPKPGWIDKAERRMRRSAESDTGSDGRAEEPPRATAAPVELGDYYDTASALALANSMINRGEVQEGLALLNAIRVHIIRRDDPKSRRLLLPAVEAAIDREYHRQTDKRRIADSDGARRPGPAFAAASPMPGHVSGDVVSRFKLHMIDVVAVVTALAWTHSMLVHEISTLPGVAVSPMGANVVAGSVLAIVLHLLSRTRRV